MLTSGAIGAWLDTQDWNVYRETGDHVLADRRLLGTNFSYVLALRQSLSGTWSAQLILREFTFVTTVGPTSRQLGRGEGFTTLEELGLFIGGLMSRGPHGEAA